MDEQTLEVLVNYTARALKECSTWTHPDILLALSTVVYGNGPHCHQVDVSNICESIMCPFSNAYPMVPLFPSLSATYWVKVESFYSTVLRLSQVWSYSELLSPAWPTSVSGGLYQSPYSSCGAWIVVNCSLHRKLKP